MPVTVLLSSLRSTPDVPRLLVLCLLCQGLVRQLHEEHHHAAGEEIRHPQLSDRRH